MALVLFDTNILIDCLKGYQPAIDEVTYWDDAAISAITWMEVMAGTTGEERGAVLEFLGNFEVIHTDRLIMEFAYSLRKDSIEMGKKVALPDAIIMATGLSKKRLIITRNVRDFEKLKFLRKFHGSEVVRVPYELTNTTPVGFINVIPQPE
jgi:predicted nucleic acid-binding protein